MGALDRTNGRRNSLWFLHDFDLRIRQQLVSSIDFNPVITRNEADLLPPTASLTVTQATLLQL